MSDISQNRLDRFIGIPFKDGGRDFDGVDCWGLVVLYYRDALGVTLPDYRISVAASTRIAKQIDEVEKSGAWRELERPEPDCVVLMALDAAQPRVRQHIGVFIGQGQILHTTASMGASYLIRLNQPFMIARTRGYYEFVRLPEANADMSIFTE